MYFSVYECQWTKDGQTFQETQKQEKSSRQANKRIEIIQVAKDIREYYNEHPQKIVGRYLSLKYL